MERNFTPAFHPTRPKHLNPDKMSGDRTKHMRVLLVDDHALVRAGIRTLLEKLPFVEVAGEASNGREALELIPALRPNLLLLDIAMEGLNGLETAARVAKNFPDVKVVILSMYHNEHFLLQALRAGSVGYLLKQSATCELELALTAIMRGATYLSPALPRSLFDSFVKGSNLPATPLDQLTPRHREILQLIAEGKATKEIAFILNVSSKTVDTHRAEIMRRLHINDLPGLTRFAMRVGLVSPEL